MLLWVIPAVIRTFRLGSADTAWLSRSARVPSNPWNFLLDRRILFWGISWPLPTDCGERIGIIPGREQDKFPARSTVPDCELMSVQ